MDRDPRRIEVIDDATAEMFRRMTPEERVVRGLGMGAMAREIIEAGVRHQFPTWSDEQVQSEVARRFAGAE